MDIFWFLFGVFEMDDFKTDSQEYKYVQITGMILVGIYAIAVLVLVNMFIAILCEIYETIAVRNYFYTFIICFLLFPNVWP